MFHRMSRSARRRASSRVRVDRSQVNGIALSVHQAVGLRRRDVASRFSRMSKPAFDYRSLSIAERLQLVEDVWDSIATEQPDAAALPLTAAERAELDRRLDAHANDPAAAVPWTEVRAALRRPPKRRARPKRAKKPKRGG